MNVCMHVYIRLCILRLCYCREKRVFGYCYRHFSVLFNDIDNVLIQLSSSLFDAKEASTNSTSSTTSLPTVFIFYNMR